MAKQENIPKKEFIYCPLCGKELHVNSIEGKTRKNCHSCGFVYYKNPLPCVSIIGIKGNKIALIKRGIEPSKGSWAPPSGFMEAEEKPEETALRELYEETSLKGEIIDLLGVHTQDTKIYGSLLIIIFLVRISEGNIKAGDDALDAKFFNFEEIPEMNHDFYNTAIKKAKKWIKKAKKEYK
jgi:ADP-ribose pyrophosphatase YjhB (NUDIX family)